ncbi:hypothetical protein DPMN_080464 [Dreissena polymorpha]|uniref:Uncharacterized protein n=1 Tax=Dreissena polymorpha TaxID=45954 RepID=A0A9D4BRT2_DREPO|nr:hypothetical protein DPMN_080464 [Dreissena polymorpha]
MTFDLGYYRLFIQLDYHPCSVPFINPCSDSSVYSFSRTTIHAVFLSSIPAAIFQAFIQPVYHPSMPRSSHRSPQ